MTGTGGATAAQPLECCMLQKVCDFDYSHCCFETRAALIKANDGDACRRFVDTNGARCDVYSPVERHLTESDTLTACAGKR